MAGGTGCASVAGASPAQSASGPLVGEGAECPGDAGTGTGAKNTSRSDGGEINLSAVPPVHGSPKLLPAAASPAPARPLTCHFPAVSDLRAPACSGEMVGETGGAGCASPCRSNPAPPPTNELLVCWQRHTVPRRRRR